MAQTFMTGIKINKVRHLHDVEIPLSTETRKHLILTGKNGSGKTSVFESLTAVLDSFVSLTPLIWQELADNCLAMRLDCRKTYCSTDGLASIFYHEGVAAVGPDQLKRKLASWDECSISCSSLAKLYDSYRHGTFMLAAYGADRSTKFNEYKHLETVDIKPVYGLNDHPAKDFCKYMASQKARRSFARDEGNEEFALSIAHWFDRLENVLRRIYSDDSLRLDFDPMTFQFSLHMDGREPFTFNTMSLGYSAIFDIISDLMMRMESQHRYDLEGIVLIDEIEAHLHVELQRQIFPILTELFPNIQFIVTTHSPFVLSSAKNAVIYDLENGTLVEDGLTGLPYEGVVEGYFRADRFSAVLRKKFDEYKKLVNSPQLSDLDYAKIDALEMYLDEIPGFLAVDFSEEYERLKLEFSERA